MQTLTHPDRRTVNTGTYRVTRTAEALAGLVADALVEAACCGSPALAQTLAAAVRDAAELAGALPPATRAHDLQVCSRQLRSECVRRSAPLQPGARGVQLWDAHRT